jgi:hypothetical protein
MERDPNWPFKSDEPQPLATLDAGTYWIGDPSYSFTPDQWNVLLDRGSWLAGVVTAHVDELVFVAVLTEAGDGIYPDADGFEYAVDSGMVGVTPARPDQPKHELVREVTFGESVKVEWKPFQLRVGDVEVDLRARSLS